jgi:hypothetical protein
MSKYTTEVRFICENYAGLTSSVDGDRISDVIEKAREKVFDFDFPIYDESYRSVLETKILKRYYTREIGFETVGLWKHFLDMRLNEIMPYYNQMYKSTLLEFNPFYDVDLTTDSNRGIKHDETTTRDTNRTSKETSASTTTRTDNLKFTTETEQESTDTSNSTNSGKVSDKYSDTPQNGISNVENGTYLTNARITDTEDSGTSNSEGNVNTSVTGTNTGTQGNTGTATVSGNGNVDEDGTRKYSNTDEYLEHVKGKRGGDSYSKLLQEYRKTFMNIDVMIIDELGDLFINLW